MRGPPGPLLRRGAPDVEGDEAIPQVEGAVMAWESGVQTGDGVTDADRLEDDDIHRAGKDVDPWGVRSSANLTQPPDPAATVHA